MKPQKDLTNVYVNRWGHLIYSSFEYSSTFQKFVEYLHHIVSIAPSPYVIEPDEITDHLDIDFIIQQYDINTD